MSTPIITAHRNLAQRISKLLLKGGEIDLTPWQLRQVQRALEQLEGYWQLFADAPAPAVNPSRDWQPGQVRRKRGKPAANERASGNLVLSLEQKKSAPEWMRNRPHDLARRFVLALPLIRHLPQQVVFGPRQVGHLHDQLGPHPVHARQFQRRAEAAVARWWRAEGSGCW
jgi:hypothetical protein